MNTAEVSVVEKFDEFSSMEKDWDNLLAVTPRATPFQSHAWLSTWWEVFSESYFSLRIILVKTDGRLIAAIPLYKRRLQFNFITYTELCYVGTGGGHEDEVCTEYLDALYNPDEESLVMEALTNYLSNNPLQTDLYHFSAVLEGSLLGRLYSLPLLARVTTPVGQVSGLRYHVDLPESYDKFLENLSTGTRKNLLQGLRRAERMGDLHLLSADNEELVDDYFRILCDLHADRWGYKGKPGVFASRHFLAFHGNIIKRFHKKGWLHLHVLKIDEEPIAVLYNFIFNGVEYYYQGGINITDYGKTRPGTIMIAKSIEQAIAGKLRIYDMMQGGFESYKSGYGCTTEKMYSSLYFTGTWRARLLYGLHRFTKRIGYLVYNNRVVKN